MGGCAAAIALSAKTKGISTTCKHLSKIVKLPTTKLTPCISWAGGGGMTIGANHFGGGPMGGCAALSTELRVAHEKMCGGPRQLSLSFRTKLVKVSTQLLQQQSFMDKVL